MNNKHKSVLTAIIFSTVLLLAARTLVDLTRDTTGLLPGTSGGTGVNSSATYPASGTIMITTTSATCGQLPALTGDTTSSAGSCATVVAKDNGVSITTVTSLGTTGTISMNFALGRVFTMTPTGTVTLNATGCTSGAIATLIVTTSGTSSFTITPTTNFKGTALATGTTTAKTFGWSFICNGTTAVQMGAATAAM